jgi:hypothetical protein
MTLIYGFRQRLSLGAVVGIDGGTGTEPEACGVSTSGV